MIQRALEPGDDRSKRAMVVTQQRSHLFGFCMLGKGREPANIAEHNDNLPAMTFENAFVATRDNQFC